ncbi:MAG: hypothetical protein FWF71_08080 [Actinomycetia bacterium]|nr:hypothetical protein [Actinomycetes bacterium]
MDEQETNSPRLSWWRACPKLYVNEVSAGNKSYRFFAELSDEEELIEYDSLPLEFFNHELQRVDTTSEKSLLLFCEKWGLVLSPLYASKTHALSLRDNSDGLTYTNYYPVSYRDGIEALEKRLAEDIVTFKGSCGFNSVDKAVERVIGSEFAREAVVRGDYGNFCGFGAVVSVDEVAYTVRLLQIATAMQAAFGAGMRGSDILTYLLNDRVIPRRHPYELEESTGMDLFFGTSRNAWELHRQQEAVDGCSAEDDDDDERKAVKKRMQAIMAIEMELGVENCRTFTKQAALNLAMENAWAREDGDKPEGDMFWGISPQVQEGSIVEAILANFDYVMASEFEWITCDHCGRIFKYQKEYDPTNRYRKSMFCKNGCRVMNAQESKRLELSGNAGLTPNDKSQRS